MISYMVQECEILANCDLPQSVPDGYTIRKLAGDASTRSYYRITTPANTSLVLMQMPEPFDPRHFAYLQNYDLLRGRGVPVAEVYFLQADRGWVFLQDLGDHTLYDLYAGWNDRTRLFRMLQAMDILRNIELTQPENPLAFDAEKFSWELNFFLEHFLMACRECNPSAAEIQGFRSHFKTLAKELASRPRVFCHRDYHSRNLMLFQDRIYVVDFQDARLGPATYDLASLCYDSYLGHSPEMIRRLEDYFFTYHPDPEMQRWEYPRMCLQRNLKALGTFGYQSARLGRKFYLQFVPATLASVHRHLELLPEYKELAALLQNHLPELT